MDLPDLVLVLLGVVIAAVALVLVIMNRRREHALRDRFAEEYDRILHEESRGDPRL